MLKSTLGQSRHFTSPQDLQKIKDSKKSAENMFGCLSASLEKILQCSHHFKQRHHSSSSDSSCVLLPTETTSDHRFDPGPEQPAPEPPRMQQTWKPENPAEDVYGWRLKYWQNAGKIMGAFRYPGIHMIQMLGNQTKKMCRIWLVVEPPL